MKTVIATILVVVAFILASLSIKYNWEWFIANPFDLQQISMVHAMGLSIFVSAVMGIRGVSFYYPEEIKDYSNIFVAILWCIVSVATLIMGWIFSFAM